MKNQKAIFRLFQPSPFSLLLPGKQEHWSKFRNSSRALWDTRFCTHTSDYPFPNPKSRPPRLSVDQCGSAEPRGMGVVSPLPPQDPSPLRGTLGSSLRSPAEGEGNEGFPPPPEKNLDSPSSTRLQALVPSRDSRARTRSPSPRAWRPDFPGAAREAP